MYEAHLLRRTYREGGKVKNETLANLSRLPRETIELVRRSLRGEQFLSAVDGFEVCRSLPHGHVAAVLGMARRLELARLLDRAPSPQRARVLAMVVQQVLAPGSKLACTRALSQSTLAEELALAGVDADELYAALDWLSERQEQIERRLARRHLEEGSHVLYDVSSSYFEGRTCPLLALGYSRDGRRGSLQIVYGLLLEHEGRPLAIELFPGGLHDDKTLPAQIEKLRARFGFTTLVLIVDRGMATKATPSFERLSSITIAFEISSSSATADQLSERERRCQPKMSAMTSSAASRPVRAPPSMKPWKSIVVCSPAKCTLCWRTGS